MKAESMWDRLANNWDTPGVSLGQNDLHILERMKNLLHAGDVVVDCGCATGSIAIEIAGTVAKVYGIDISSKMVDLAKRKAAERQVENVSFMHATIFDERLEPESVDLILASSVLHLLEDPAQVVNRVHQLLKPGGWFVSATPCLDTGNWVSVLTRLPLSILSKIGILPHINFFSVSGLAGTITNGNFQIVENENLSVHSVMEHFITARKC